MRRRRRKKNDVLVELRSKPRLVEALKQIGLSEKTASKIADAYPEGRGLDNAPRTAIEQLGATPAQSARVVAAFEIARACDQACAARLEHGRTMRGPREAADLIRNAIGRREQEYFVVLLLDARSRVLDLLGVAVGSLARVEVHPREVFREAIRRGAHSVILAHNHPTGDPTPSDSDIEITRRLVDVGRLAGIPVVDSLVVTRTDFASIGATGAVPGLAEVAPNPAALRSSLLRA